MSFLNHKNRQLTEQEKFWSSDFGKNYTERNTFDIDDLEESYRKKYGTSQSALNEDFLKGLPIKNILEVGCNYGAQLQLLQKQGFTDCYGIDIQRYAIERAHQVAPAFNVIYGSALDIPFKDKYFDLVFTAGVLIHIHPSDIKKVMTEIYRVSKKYIYGTEYFNDNYQEIEYRGNKNRLWKANFYQMYLDLFPDLRLIKDRELNILGTENKDTIFLLSK